MGFQLIFGRAGGGVLGGTCYDKVAITIFVLGKALLEYLAMGVGLIHFLWRKSYLNTPVKPLCQDH